MTTHGSAAKHSTPSRAYLHLTNEEYIGLLADKIRGSNFADAKWAVKDSATFGPPTVEFAPYSRVPNGRIRQDLRQGTIDQDQEFISFLESLTNPIIKPAQLDHGPDAALKNKEKIVTTPLVQFLKDKKANKGKEITTVSKISKHTRQDSKDNPSAPVIDKRPSSRAINPNMSPEKSNAQMVRTEKAARNVVRVMNEQAAEIKKGSMPSSAIASATATPKVDTDTPKPERKRERGNASAAAKILQRDLGLGTNLRGRGGRRGGVMSSPKPTTSDLSSVTGKQDGSPFRLPETEGDVPNAVEKNPNKIVAPAKKTPDSSRSSASPQPPRGPAASRPSPQGRPSSDAKSPISHSGTVPTRNLSISPTATQAFLKHANPSQGVNEPLLEAAFAEFGVVKKVEIDKKKGFAYVDFAEPKGLQEAIRASPVKVAQGQVVVLERKTGPSLHARNVRGGSSMMGGRGGPMDPRGGRGGGMRRGGGVVRGGGNGPHHHGLNVSPAEAPQTTNPTAAAPAPAAPLPADPAANSPMATQPEPSAASTAVHAPAESSAAGNIPCE